MHRYFIVANREQGEGTMSKLKIRIALSVLISLGVILAIVTTVQGASLHFASDRVGSHLVGGAMTNFNHDRLTAAELDAYQAELDAFNSSTLGPGHDCGSGSYDGPID
jgi:hypothetical protein